MRKILVLILITGFFSCGKHEIEEDVILSFVEEIYIRGEGYEPEKLNRYITPSNVEILNKLSTVKKDYLKYIVELYQDGYKTLKGDVEIIHYNKVNKDLLKNRRIIYDDFTNLYCVVNNNQILNIFITEKSKSGKIYVKSFSTYIPSVGGQQPIIFKEFETYNDPVVLSH